MDPSPLYLNRVDRVESGDIPNLPNVTKEERGAYLAEKFERPEPVYSEKLSGNFLGATIVKRIDGTYFAVRKSGNIWEGSEFKLMDDGFPGAVYQVHTLPPEIIKAVETELSFTLPVLNRDLMNIGVASPEEKSSFVTGLKNLPEGSMIDLYHGLNGGSASALQVLDSESRGVKQISGPCLAAYPVGQFWKPGDAGFKYSILKDNIEFPGESKPEAKFRMYADGIVTMINGLTELPIDQYDGVVMRTERKVDVTRKELVADEWEDVVVGEKIVPITTEERLLNKEVQKKLGELAITRKAKGV